MTWKCLWKNVQYRFMSKLERGSNEEGANK